MALCKVGPQCRPSTLMLAFFFFGVRPVTSAGGARPRPADNPPGQVPPHPPLRPEPDRYVTAHIAYRISPESQVRLKIMGRAQRTLCTVWHLLWPFWHRIFCSTASLASRAPAFEASRIHFPTIGWPRLVRPRCQRTLNNPGATCGNFSWRNTVELRFTGQC